MSYNVLYFWIYDLNNNNNNSVKLLNNVLYVYLQTAR